MNKVLLIGDSCLDEYIYGNVDKRNYESPSHCFVEESRCVSLGMAVNVERNLKNLGISVDLVTTKDQSKKTRYIDSKSGYQLFRVDEDVKPEKLEIQDFKIGKYDLRDYDTIVISDYDKGFITKEFILEIQEHKLKRNFLIFLDSKKTDLKDFKFCIIKINMQEYINSNIYNLQEYMNSNVYNFRNLNLIVTDGSNGALFNDRIYSIDKKVNVRDVCGAGDTFLASLVYSTLKGMTTEESIKFANKAASITVTKLGTYAPTIEEIFNL